MENKQLVSNFISLPLGHAPPAAFSESTTMVATTPYSVLQQRFYPNRNPFPVLPSAIYMSDLTHHIISCVISCVACTLYRPVETADRTHAEQQIHTFYNYLQRNRTRYAIHSQLSQHSHYAQHS